MEDRKFNAEHRHKLNNPERLEILDPKVIWGFLDLQQKPEQIVDIGAGTGYITAALARRYPSAKIDALDIEPLMVQAMKDDLASDINIKPQLMEDGKLPLDDNHADVIWMINLYHELKSPHKLLREIKRVLKPGGKLLIIDWARKPEACDAGPPIEHRIEESTITSHLIEADFANIKTTSDFEIYTAVVGQKD